MTDNNKQRVALVTGASSGSGRAIAARLARGGWRVFGTSRKPQSETLDGFELLPLDVTNEESARACVALVLERAGRLDALVNNAGVDMLGGAEETTIDELKWLFETNFFGAVRMIQAALPTMRAQRGGVIINISSMAGLGGAPFQGAYTASKGALENYMESLWYEVEPFGIRVALVEPGFFKSEIGNRMPKLSRPIADYDAERQRLYVGWERLYRSGTAPVSIAELVAAIAEGRKRGWRYAIGAETRFANWSRVVPDWMVQQRIRWLFGLKTTVANIQLIAAALLALWLARRR